jgi:HPt (histidine-containing phosphotransfer) domain-containing protein
MSNDRAIDIEKLKELYGDTELTEIFELFLVEANNLILAMRKYLEEREVTELGTQAHQLKGLAAVMAADSLSEKAQAVEQALKNSSWELINQAQDALEVEYSRVTNFIRTFLSNGTK